MALKRLIFKHYATFKTYGLRKEMWSESEQGYGKYFRIDPRYKKITLKKGIGGLDDESPEPCDFTMGLFPE